MVDKPSTTDENDKEFSTMFFRSWTTKRVMKEETTITAEDIVNTILFRFVHVLCVIWICHCIATLIVDWISDFEHKMQFMHYSTQNKKNNQRKFQMRIRICFCCTIIRNLLPSFGRCQWQREDEFGGVPPLVRYSRRGVLSHFFLSLVSRIFLVLLTTLLLTHFSCLR